MPNSRLYYPGPSVPPAVRAEIRRALLAKGLMEGSQKYQEVFARKLVKARRAMAWNDV